MGGIEPSTQAQVSDGNREHSWASLGSLGPSQDPTLSDEKRPCDKAYLKFYLTYIFFLS